MIIYLVEDKNIESSRPKEVPVTKDEIKQLWTDYLFTHQETPQGIVFEITNHCPNNCAHCYAPGIIGKNTMDMSFETFQDWMEVLASFPTEQRPEQIWLVGGEPTKHPQIEDFIKITKDSGFEAVLVTTGESLSDEEFCQKITPNIDEAAISIRGYGAFHDIMMLPTISPLLSSPLENISPQQQIIDVIHMDNINSDTNNTDLGMHFHKTIEGLL